MQIAEKTFPVNTLVAEARSGDRLSLARLLTKVENGTPEGQAALDALYPFSGQAYLIGITGAPGTGKSSLVNQLARAFRERNPQGSTRVAVVAVDPTSPFSGGAVLGDRVRMRDLTGDKGVFIRSMASRGALGGLARATSDVVQVFDAVGYDVILIETVGAGQSEVDIARLAHTTLVVDAPGMGDDVQAIKAGILEIADILVVNKADRPGAEIALRVLRNMLDYAHPGSSLYRHPRCPEPEIPLQLPFDPKQDLVSLGWTPVVVPTVAIHGDGMEELMQAIQSHHDYLESSGERSRRDQERLQSRLSALIQAGLAERWRAGVSDDFFQDVFARLAARQISPYEAVQQLLGNSH